MSMLFFKTRKPRKFRKVSIYTDENKERLQKLVDDTLRKEGKAPAQAEEYDTSKFNGTFSNYTPRAKKYSEQGSRVSWPLAVVVIVVLIVIWRFLMTGAR